MGDAVLMRGETVLIPRVELAFRWHERLKGLLGRASLPEGQGLYLDPCGSIHTFGMQFPIDVIFVDRAMRVVRVGWNLNPGLVFGGGPGAKAVFEVQSGWLEGSVETGTLLTLLA